MDEQQLKAFYKFYMREYYLSMKDAQRFLIKDRDVQYTIMKDEKEESICFLTLGLSNETNPPVELRFYCTSNILKDEEKLKLARKLFVSFIKEQKIDDIDEAYFKVETFKDPIYEEKFNKAGYALLLSNCGDPYFSIDEDRPFYGVYYLFLTREELNEIEELKSKGEDYEQYLLDLDDEGKIELDR